MSTIIIDHEIDLATARRLCKETKRMFYGANTPWWATNECQLYTKPGIELPCDPRGGMLFETDDGVGFLQSAEDNAAHYGKHGIRAFLLAYHGCVVVKETGFPTCLNNWDGYNALIDSAIQHEIEREKEE